MPLVAPFKNGEFVTSTSAQSMSKENEKKNSSGIDSEAFLTLLVAEMQNQDPLEPTSNTEWISQYATFTQVSEIQEIGNDMQSMKAQDLVGEYVIMKVTDSMNGESNYVSGQVDYVAYEEGKAFLSIGGEMYSIDDLDTVASKEYMEAYNLANEIAADIKKLPNLDNLTSSYKGLVNGLHDKTSEMNSYQKGFLDEKVFDLIDSYYNKMQTILKEEAGNSANNKSENSADSNKEDSNKEDSNVTNITNNTTNITNVYNTDEKTENSDNSKTDSESNPETPSSEVIAENTDTKEPAQGDVNSENSENNGEVSEEVIEALTKDIEE